MWKETLVVLVCVQMTACATPFEAMWQGLATCDLDRLQLDSQSGKALDPRLDSFKPDKLTDGFAWYKTHEELHGLPIHGFLVPTSTYEVHALFVDTPIANARRLVHNAYGSDFTNEQKHELGEAPLLLRDPNNPKRSIIDCTRGDAPPAEETPEEIPADMPEDALPE